MFTKGKINNSKRSRVIELPLATESFEDAHVFIEQRLSKNDISDEIIFETMLLFEALYNSLIEQGFDQNTLLTISTHKHLGELTIKLGFEGEPFSPIKTDLKDISPELRMLQAYKDRFDCRYSYGYNTISISVKRSYRGSILRCWIGIILAILVYIPMSMHLSFEERASIEEHIVYPILKKYADAMLMVGAPITFFSMIRNLTDIYIVSERSSPLRYLQFKACITSCVSVALGIVTGFVAMLLMKSYGGYLAGFGGTPSVSEIIDTLVPSSIFEPFETYMPFPLIIIALLIVYALCSTGEYLDILKQAVDIFYVILSRVLNVVMFFLPVFCFLAILTPLLAGGVGDFLMVVNAAVLIILSISVLLVFYIVRLLIAGVDLKVFVRHLPSLIRENLKINSVIDAVPFNIRFCVRKYKFNRKKISEQLPILAQINLDGNCFLIMLIAMVIILALGMPISWFHIIIISILVLFLSFGAPNQPGSILIGTLIILFYLQADTLISMAIYFEVFFGMLQNIINVTGDIVSVAIEDQKSRNKQTSAQSNPS